MSRLFGIFDDEFTVGFYSIETEEVARGGRGRRIRFEKERNRFEGTDHDFFIAAAVVQEGERLQRGIVERKLKKGTRNISNKTGRPLRFLGWAMEPQLMAKGTRKEKNRVIRELKEELHGVVQRADERSGFTGLPSPDSYVITRDVMDVAVDSGCADYFEALEGQRFLSADLAKIEAAIREEYPDAVDALITALRGTRNRDHLSMISLERRKEGGLFVTVVDPKGHHLKVEAKRFVEMINDKGESKRLFAFPKPGEREVIESSFNDRKEGDVIGKISSDPAILEVACCVGKGSILNVVDKARFYVDPEYLIGLWLVLDRMASDERRYLELKTKAETFTDFDPFTTGVS